jgi:Endosomal/lysosomal potassium channel TMEM175
MGDETKLQGGRTGECDEQVRALLERAQDPSRVLALSDGVFAIIITLLVLEIHVPELTQGHTLTEALAEVRPSFYAFAVSFIWPACTGSATATCSPSWSRGPPPA